MDSSLARRIEARLKVTIRQVTSLGGGMINEAARVYTSGGPLFVKWKRDAPSGFFAAEADGLQRLAATGAVRVPQVIGWEDASIPNPSPGPPMEDSAPPYLMLEWIKPQPGSADGRFATRFGEAVAALHAGSRIPGGEYGLEIDNFVGLFAQENGRMQSWPDFYRDRRLRPQIALARRLNYMPAARQRRLDAILIRLDELLAGAEEAPCLIHGDLWSGNFLRTGDAPVLIDPAVYYAPREMEMAYVDLFGGFPAGFREAYEASYPLPPGYTERRPLLQLYPLLNHLNHFGEQYGPRVDAACAPYVR